ncbi:MAG TPA: hypothetical protein PKD53_02955 [Chloroflexaceae bacterium]|nr:hypothetical protein [Chloroflexaceae bacterium]
MLRMRDLLAGGLLASFLMACSAAATPPADSTAAQATAAAGVGAAQTAVPGLDTTAQAGVGAAQTAAPVAQATAEAATGMTADQLAGMVGQSATVSGPVTQITDSMLFQIDDPALGPVTVLVPSGSFSLAQGQQVEVSGTVAAFDPAALEQQLGIDIDDSVVASLDSATVVVADTVNPSSASQ